MAEEILAVVKAHTDPGEAVLWAGRPSPLAYALRGNGLLAIMGFAGVGLMVTLAVDSFQLSQRYPRSSPSFFWSTFFLFGMMLPMMAMAAAPLWAWLRARATVYALTDRRALIVSRFPGLTVTSVQARQIRFVELASQKHGHGTVSFLDRPPRRWSLIQENGFHNIEDAPRVARVMRERLVLARTEAAS